MCVTSCEYRNFHIDLTSVSHMGSINDPDKGHEQKHVGQIKFVQVLLGFLHVSSVLFLRLHAPHYYRRCQNLMDEVYVIFQFSDITGQGSHETEIKMHLNAIFCLISPTYQ